MAQMTPILYDVATGDHRPAGAGEQIGVSYIPVDSSSMNLLRSNVTAGLGLFATDLVSLSAADNILKVDSQGKLYVEKPTLPDFVLLSQQQGNYARLGSDGGIYFDGNDILSNADDNMLRIDSTDNKIKLTVALAKHQLGLDNLTIVSSALGNVLTTGPDSGALLLASNLVSSATGNALQADATGKLYVGVPSAADFVASGEQLLAVDSNGKLKTTGVVSSSITGNLLNADAAGKAYLTVDNVLSTDTKNLSTYDRAGKLTTTLSMAYDRSSGDLTLTSSSGVEVAKVNIPSNGTVLESATLVTNPSGQPAGTYIQMVFKTTTGATNVVYIDVGTLVDVYTAGTGISIVGNQVSVNTRINGGIAVDTSGALYVNANQLVSASTANVLTVDAVGQMSVTASSLADSGLSVTSQGRLSVDIAGLVSSVTGNIITVDSTGKLFAKVDDVASMISTNAGNIIRLGTDNKLYAMASSLVPSTAGSGLVTNSDGTLSVKSSDLISSTTGNIITTGTDGKLFAKPSDIASSLVPSSSAASGLKVNSDGTLAVDKASLVSTASRSGLEVDSTGGLAVDENALVSSAAGNLLIVDGTGKLFVDTSNVVSAIISPSAGAGLVTDSGGRLRVDKTSLVKSDDKILSGTYDGITSTLGVLYDQATGLLTLTGIGGQTVATATIPSSTSTLESVSVVVNPAGQPAGTYLAMTFRKADGTTEVVYVDMGAVGDVYTAGNGIDITNRVVAVKLSANSGLISSSSGLAVDKTSAAAMVRSSDAGNAVSVGTDGLLYVSLDCGEL